MSFSGNILSPILFKNIKFPAILFDIKTLQILDVNEAAVSKYGYSHEEFLHLNLHSLFMENARYQSDMPTKSGIYFQQHLDKNGHPFNAEVTIEVLDQDSPHLVIALIKETDNKSQKQNEAIKPDRENFGSEDVFKALFNNAYDAFLLIDNEAKVIKANQAACNLLGYADKELLNLSILDVTGSVSLEEKRRSWNSFLQKGEVNGNSKFLRSDGSAILIEYRAIANISPGIHLAVLRDKTTHEETKVALQRTQQNLKKILAHAPVVFFSVNRQGTLTYSEGAGLHNERIVAGEFVGRSIYDLYGSLEVIVNAETPMQYKAKGSKVIDRVMNGENIHCETTLEEVVYHNTLIPVYDQHNQLDGFSGIAIDITDRKKAETIIKENENYFHTIVRSSPVPLIITRVDDGEMLFASEKYAEMLGIPVEQYKKFNIKDFYFDESEREKLLSILEEKGIVEGYKLRVRRFDGSLFWCIVTMQIIQLGSEKAIIAGAQDISADIEATRELEETKYMLEKTLASLDDAVLVVNGRTQKILSCNRAVNSVFGYAINELKGESIQILYPDESSFYKYQRQLSKSFGRDESFHIEIPLKQRNGKQIIADVTSTKLFDYKKNTSNIVSIVRDVTDKKKQNERLLQSVIQGEDNERRRLAKDLHDGLGQLLTAAKLNFSSTENQIKDLDVNSIQQFETGLSFLDDAIEESRNISQNLIPQSLEDFGLLSSMESLFKRMKKTSSVDINFYHKINEEKLSSQVQLHLYRITQESIHNVIRHSRATQVTIQMIMHEHDLIYTIEDNGQGFNPEKNGSDGIGLESIKNRILSMAGFIEINSSIGKGASITIEIPLS